MKVYVLEVKCITYPECSYKWNIHDIFTSKELAELCVNGRINCDHYRIIEWDVKSELPPCYTRTKGN